MPTVEISSVWVVVAACVTVLSIGIAFLRVRKFVEDRIHEALAKAETIERIALLVKPDMVFDENGSIIADRGACAFIEERGIHITIEEHLGTRPRKMPAEIRIAFKKHLKAPPLLTSLNPETVLIRARRGEGHDWIFTFAYSMTIDDERECTRSYRLEIL